MIKINLDKCTYFFNPSIFNNDNIQDYKTGSLIVWMLLRLKTKNNSVKYGFNSKNMTLLNDCLMLDSFLTGDLIHFIPIKAMFFMPKSKLNGIWAFSMSTSTYCNGIKYNTCKACNGSKNYCYGVFFESCRTRVDVINSIEANFISGFIFRHVDVYALSDWINKKGIKYIRFNGHGSFIDIESINKLVKLAYLCQKTLFYGYNEYNEYSNILLEKIHKKGIKNLIVNGSNHKAHNTFINTSDLNLYYSNQTSRCLDSCIKCKKCLKNNDSININLIHGFLKDIDTLFYTSDNIKFIESFFNNQYSIDSFKGKYFLTRIKNLLKTANKDLTDKFDMTALFEPVDTIKNYKDLIFYLESNYL